MCRQELYKRHVQKERWKETQWTWKQQRNHRSFNRKPNTKHKTTDAAHVLHQAHLVYISQRAGLLLKHQKKTQFFFISSCVTRFATTSRRRRHPEQEAIFFLLCRRPPSLTKRTRPKLSFLFRLLSAHTLRLVLKNATPGADARQ